MRYTVTMDFYIQADSSLEAISIASEFARNQRAEFDNVCDIELITENPVGTMESTQIFKR